MTLVNTFFDEEVLPEYLQEKANPDNLKACILRFLDDPNHYRAVQSKLETIHQFLGEKGVLDSAAEGIFNQSNQLIINRS